MRSAFCERNVNFRDGQGNLGAFVGRRSRRTGVLEAMDEQEHSRSAGTRRGRVLVVDDSRVVRAVVADSLRRAGYEVDEAENGRAALGLLQRGAYDVIVTDLRMPELDGFSVLTEVRNTAPGVEVVILTGTYAHDVDSAIRALRLGAHDYIPKSPDSGDEVVRTVDRALEKKRKKEADQRLVAELWNLGHTDPVTGMPNRRAFDLALIQEVSRARRHAHELALAILDLDHFKTVNDTYGHTAGDSILRAFAEVVALHLREGDLLYRIGGEEFAALLPVASTTGAMTVAERIVEAVAATHFKIGSSSLSITVSIGVASLSGSNGLPSDLVACADAALYRAKSAGRNLALAGGNPEVPTGGKT